MKPKVQSPYKAFLSTFLNALEGRSIASCSDWAERYRVMGKPFPGPWSFEHHPWLREMHDSRSERIVGQKAAQMGYTECALNRAFYAIDIEKENVLYVLPATNPDANEFSTSRFDPALELSNHLSKIFSDVKNRGHKRAGACSLFVRGSRSRSQMKSIPAGRMFFDEVDEMVQDNITLAFERMSGQEVKIAFLLSTPTRDDYGINRYFNNSNQKHFFFKCPHCSKMTELVFPDCLVVTAEVINDPAIRNSHIICKECKTKLAHEEKRYFLKDGVWVPACPTNSYDGYHISQLYSMTAHPAELATAFLTAGSNPTDEQEFFNSKMGLTHVVKGGQILDGEIEECIGGYQKMQRAPYGGVYTLGIDVGAKLDYEVVHWSWDREARSYDVNVACHAKVVDEGRLNEFHELDRLMADFRINFAIIDQDPERRMSKAFAERFPGRAATCKYTAGLDGKVMRYNEAEKSVHVDRTFWMDASLSRFHSGRERITLPANVSLEYRDHMKAPARIYKKDTDGNPYGVYVTAENKPDHHAHARTYAEVALPFAMCALRNEDIGDIYGR